MSNAIEIRSTSNDIDTKITLTGSKSITNRALLIRALSNTDFDISNISESDDSIAMDKILNQAEGPFDAGHAGTTYRFLTAYFAFRKGTQILTGSERMKQRPIKALVDALNSLGANITYEINEGYPPLIIHPPSEDIKRQVSVKADVSSQYLSALLMVGPTLPNGIELTLVGDLVSRPYLMMTLSIMQEFGVTHTWTENTITIEPQAYQAKSYFVEADWSSASYLYSWASLSDSANIEVTGLFKNSLQGDSAIATIAESFGVTTTDLGSNKMLISKEKDASIKSFIEYDFIEQPDIAQTVFAMCAGRKVNGLFTGLQTLYIKETDRIKAFQNELGKIGVYLSKVPQKFKKNDDREFFMIEGEIQFNETPAFDTYHDHRMAMALAPLARIHPVIINESNVVSKSYPTYWADVVSMGCQITEI
jgi:3-phosphoshikimate 1-carboxyvinyltransferase